MMSFMSCDYEATLSGGTTAAPYEDEGPATTASSAGAAHFACPRMPLLLPEATELDRLLVRATEAAIHAAASPMAAGASNGNNDGNTEDVDHRERDSSPEAMVIANHSSDKKLKKKQKKNQQQQQQQPMTLKRRVRSLFAFMLSGSKSQQQQQQQAQKHPRVAVNRSNRHDLEEDRHLDGVVGHENVGCGGRCAKRHPAVECGSPLPDNASNVQLPDGEGGNSPAAVEAPGPPADVSASQEPKSQQLGPSQSPEGEPASEAAAAPPSPTVPASSAAKQPPPIARPRMIRGGATTAEHRRVQESIFKECRIVPVSTLYKKVAMVPGRQRLFFSAPTNPRTMGSRMLYDIAYENFRHHSDCNRDFARVGLKKICSNYCQPSQFRYVY